MSSPLQEILVAQRAVLIGLIAHITGTPLQDDLEGIAGRLLQLGQDILAASAAGAGPVTDRGVDRPREIQPDPAPPGPDHRIGR